MEGTGGLYTADDCSSITIDGIGGLYTADDCSNRSIAIEDIGGLYTADTHCGVGSATLGNIGWFYITVVDCGGCFKGRYCESEIHNMTRHITNRNVRVISTSSLIYLIM